MREDDPNSGSNGLGNEDVSSEIGAENISAAPDGVVVINTWFKPGIERKNSLLLVCSFSRKKASGFKEILIAFVIFCRGDAKGGGCIDKQVSFDE